MMKRSTTGLMTLLAAAIAAACASTGNTGFPGGGSGDGGSGPDGTIVTYGPDGAVIVASRDGSTTVTGKDGSTTVTGKDGSTTGTGKDSGTVVTGKDSGTVVTGKDSGTTSTGDAAPPPPVTPCDLCAAAGGTCNAGVCALTENPGAVSSATQSQLQTGGTGDAALKWLYPYNNTVFPRGILSPTMQFAGTAPSAVMVQISFTGMSYTGYFGASSAPLGGGQVTLPAATWTAVTAMATATDAVQVSLTKISGGHVAGPITETWTIAQGEARGTIYYETYSSALIGGIGGVGIMKIQPGATAPTPVKKGCGNVCHTASADGSTLVAATGLLSSASYDLKTSASLIKGVGGNTFTYGGLYPDGTFEMSATNYRTWTLAPSRLYNTATGASIPAPGWDNTITNAGTSSFSPDGTRIAFNHEDKGGGHTLAVMNFALATHGFSGLVDIASDSARTLAWPAWTPDNASVIYHAGSSAAFETDESSSDAGGPTTGDVYMVDVASHTVARMDALDGYSSGGTSYLPANDPNLSFAPTVLPEAVGGYFWVVFTSHRSYGNTSPSMENNDVNGKLWVAAVDIGGTPGQDSSHPAFFLQGQEMVSDNLRGFWVLDPCQASGSACTGGDQCCTGYCRAVSGSYQCVGAPASGCSNELERCATSANCCGTNYQCINNKCASVAPK